MGAEHRTGRDVVVVPHTHWDREWYAPFQTFRLRLVELLDELLPLLEADPGYRHFMLDGQMAVVDDYLAMRPGEAHRLRRLAAAQRLAMGPWYILMDEFLVSGETIVRNLQLGLERAAAFGGASDVAYLPDMFGHIAQMPQILRRFGFEHTVVWRGVPAAIDRSGFWWTAPDGSTVRAEYLPDGYGNGASLPSDAKDLVAAIARFEAHHGEVLVGPILWMNGTDHLLPQPWLGRVVAEANDVQDDYALRIDSLSSYVRSAATDGLPSWTGELRSGSRANLLMGVASNRVDVKQAAAVTERSLERLAEPLTALFVPPARWPAAFLAEAWLGVIRNSAHDSSCACSHDEVVDAVLVRYQEARQIADGLTARAVAAVAEGLRSPGPVAVNASARRRSGLIEVLVPGHEPVAGTQALELVGGDDVTDRITRSYGALLVQAALDRMPTLAAAHTWVDDGVFTAHLTHDPERLGPRYDGPVLAEAKTAAVDDPDGPARVVVSTPPQQRALAFVPDVDGFGWARWDDRGAGPLVPVTVDDGAADGSVTVTNGVVTLVVAGDGTFSLIGDDGGPPAVRADGLGRLVDDGDAGDTYNYNPPGRDVVVHEPDHVAVRCVERGPLRARVVVARRYTWPTHVDGDARVGEIDVPTTTVLEVVADSPVVRITTELDNRSKDHRLRVVFPLPAPTATSVAECAFGVVSRGLTAEGGATERALPTFPSRRFVCAGGLTVVHEGLLEYELIEVDDATGAAGALALTLLRCTGSISRGPMAYRPLPAGPATPTPHAQMPGRQVLRYGVRLGDDVGDAYAAVDDAFLPLLVGASVGMGNLDDRGTALAVEGAEVSAVLRDAGGRLVVRLFNPTDAPTTATLPGRRGWRTDLRGRATEPFEEQLPLAPAELAALVLDES